MDRIKSKKDYTKIAAEIDELKDKEHKLLIVKAEQEDVKRRIKEMESFLKSEPKELIEYDASLVRKYIKRIEIYEDRFNVTFKSGISVNVNRI